MKSVGVECGDMKTFLILTILFFLPISVDSEELSLEKIYLAKEIITLDDAHPEATAVLVRGDRVAAIGGVEQLQRDFPNVELDRRFVENIMVPGLIEHHVHPLLAAITMGVDVIAIEDWILPGKKILGVRDRQGYIDRLRAAEKQQLTTNIPLVTWGFHHYFHDKLTRQDLDAISNSRPILVIHRSFHEFIMNTPALTYFGITPEFIDNLDTEARQYASFENGHFLEQGAVSVLPNLMQYLAAPERLITGLQMTEKYLHQNGITLIANPGAMLVKSIQEAKNYVLGDIDTPFRTYFIPSGMFLAENYEADALVAEAKKLMSWGSGKLQYLPGHIKLFTDGAMYSQNMVMRDGYIDGHQGAWLMQEKTYREAFQQYWDADYQIHIHQNGDAGLDRLLDVLEENLSRNPRVDHRTVIVHFGYSQPEQIARIKKLGAIVSANPYYVTALSDLYSRRGIGAARSQQMVRLGDVQRAGIPISLHSDMPMAPGAPLQLMHSAVNRVNFANEVAGPDQRISPEQALRAVTVNAAYTLGLEKDYGSISIGKYANFTLLAENPLTIDPLKINEIEIRGTMVEGRHFPID